MLIEAMLILGLLMASLVAVEVLLVVAGTARRLAAAARPRGVERQLLHLELETARRRLKREEQSVAGWNGNRKFRVERKVSETPDICSGYLGPHDKQQTR